MDDFVADSGETNEELPAPEMAATPTEVEMEAGGLRVRVSSARDTLDAVSAQAVQLWLMAERSTPRRQVGFEAQNILAAERRPVADVGWNADAERSNWDSGRD